MEKELVKQAKKGNKKAFEEIILHYQNDLYRIAKTRFNDEEDINDAIQETIISAYESIGKLFNTDKIKSWLITILINKCNHIYKQKQKNNFISYDNINAERYVSSLDKNDSDLEFNNLINLLNDDEKTIIVLYYAEGYKTKEIAKILKMKESTVRNKILRAKRKIHGMVVVTKEEYKPHSAQLPNVCEALGVKWISYDEFMEELSASGGR